MKLDHNLPLKGLELTETELTALPEQLLTNLELAEEKLDKPDLPLLLNQEEQLEGDLKLLPLNEGEQEELLLLNSLNTLDRQDKLSNDQLLLNE